MRHVEELYNIMEVRYPASIKAVEERIPFSARRYSAPFCPRRTYLNFHLKIAFITEDLVVNDSSNLLHENLQATYCCFNARLEIFSIYATFGLLRSFLDAEQRECNGTALKGIV